VQTPWFAFTCVAACTLARSPEFVTLSEGFRHFVSSMPARVASGWSESPGGACTHWKAPPSHGAPPNPTFRPRRRPPAEVPISTALLVRLLSLPRDVSVATQPAARSQKDASTWQRVARRHLTDLIAAGEACASRRAGWRAADLLEAWARYCRFSNRSPCRYTRANLSCAVWTKAMYDFPGRPSRARALHPIRRPQRFRQTCDGSICPLGLDLGRHGG
jgi:hypothetical protein